MDDESMVVSATEYSTNTTRYLDAADGGTRVVVTEDAGEDVLMVLCHWPTDEA